MTLRTFGRHLEWWGLILALLAGAVVCTILRIEGASWWLLLPLAAQSFAAGGLIAVWQSFGPHTKETR